MLISEGNLIPAEILDSVANGTAAGQKPADFGLDPNRRVTDEIAAVWTEVRDYWRAFGHRRHRLRAGESPTTLTREAWVLPLLNALGYDPLTYQPTAAVINGRSYAVSHRAGVGEDAPPVHIGPFPAEGEAHALDRKPESGKPRLSPHGLVQEYLNLSEDHLWGLTTNGAQLRLLRDSSRTARPTYLEWDLRAMMEGDRFSDFALLYRLLHRSRLPQPGADPASSLLERYHQEALVAGGRVRERLREGVQEALERLGAGLLAHPANAVLRTAVTDGTLPAPLYYRQLLRLVYRLLFLMVAEERGLLPAPTTGPVVGGPWSVDEKQPSSTNHRGSADTQNTDHGPRPTAHGPRPTDHGPRTTDHRPRPTDHSHIYRDHYSVTRLRRLAESPAPGRARYSDLWLGLRATFRALEDDGGAQALGVAALDGDLFGADALPALMAAGLDNAILLRAIYALSVYSDTAGHSKLTRRVNYRALDVEELGSVYESLLDLRPVIAATPDGPRFHFAQGTERKTTGSYYTRPELVRELIGSALEPVLAARLSAAGPAPAARAAAILGLTVCDPACGSGHFLLAAARRLGRELAAVRTGEDQPGPAPFRQAVRDVIGRCIYGVDLNPLAVDLCKLALWIEGYNSGLPLNFLDHHIRWGNSLVGATAALVAGGIPDAAYDAVTGDDKPTATATKKRNKQDREAIAKSGHYQGSLPFADVIADGYTALAAAARALEVVPDDSVAAVHRKAEEYAGWQTQAEADRTRYNLWTAAFFLPLRPGATMPTTATLQDYRHSPSTYHSLVQQVNRLADSLRFFHWELEFPAVFEQGGFDVVLGNPPWERIKLQEEEHWVDDPYIGQAPNKAARDKRLAEYRASSDRAKQARIAHFDFAKHAAEAEAKFVHDSKRFPLTGVGDVNTYALFAEQARKIISDAGRAGIILPTGIATDDSTKLFFSSLIQEQSLVRLIGFENEAFIFPSVHHSFKFCAFTIAGRATTIAEADLAFLCRRFSDIEQRERHFTLTKDQLALINPNTYTCPIFRTKVDAELTKRIYSRVPVLVNEPSGTNPWRVSFMRMLDMANDSNLFANESGSGLLPLYEAKLLHQFTHRWGTYEGIKGENLRKGLVREPTLDELRNPTSVAIPRYWVSEKEVIQRLSNRWNRNWLIGWRDITTSVVERTLIASILPLAACGDTLLLMFPEIAEVRLISCLLATLCSITLDFVTRQKVAGVHLKYFTMRQLPVLPPSAFSAADVAYLSERVLELVYTAWDLQPFAADLWAELDGPARARVQARWAASHAAGPAATGQGPAGPVIPTDHGPPSTDPRPPPPFRWDDTRRAAIRAEIDARIARLYGLTRDELRYILDPADIYGPDFPGETFRVLKEREQRQYGEYRTRRLVLAAWDADPRPAPDFHPGDTEPRRTVVEVDAVAGPTTANLPPTPSAPPPSAAPLVPVVAAAPPPPPSAPVPVPGTWQPGDRVRHATLGEGTVREVTAREGEAVILVQFAAGPPRRFLAHTLARL